MSKGDRSLQFSIWESLEGFLQVIKGYIEAQRTELSEIWAGLILVRLMKATIRAINDEARGGGSLLDCMDGEIQR
jgi:hypothetical protein